VRVSEYRGRNSGTAWQDRRLSRKHDARSLGIVGSIRRKDQVIATHILALDIDAAIQAELGSLLLSERLNRLNSLNRIRSLDIAEELAADPESFGVLEIAACCEVLHLARALRFVLGPFSRASLHGRGLPSVGLWRIFVFVSV